MKRSGRVAVAALTVAALAGCGAQPLTVTEAAAEIKCKKDTLSAASQPTPQGVKDSGFCVISPNDTHGWQVATIYVFSDGRAREAWLTVNPLPKGTITTETGANWAAFFEKAG